MVRRVRRGRAHSLANVVAATKRPRLSTRYLGQPLRHAAPLARPLGSSRPVHIRIGFPQRGNFRNKFFVPNQIHETGSGRPIGCLAGSFREHNCDATRRPYGKSNFVNDLIRCFQGKPLRVIQLRRPSWVLRGVMTSRQHNGRVFTALANPPRREYPLQCSVSINRNAPPFAGDEGYRNGTTTPVGVMSLMDVELGVSRRSACRSFSLSRARGTAISAFPI